MRERQLLCRKRLIRKIDWLGKRFPDIPHLAQGESHKSETELITRTMNLFDKSGYSHRLRKYKQMRDFSSGKKKDLKREKEREKYKIDILTFFLFAFPFSLYFLALFLFAPRSFAKQKCLKRKSSMLRKPRRKL